GRYRPDKSSWLQRPSLELRRQQVQEQSDVGHDAQRLGRPAVGELGHDRRVDVHADDADPRRQHVADPNPVQHRRQDDDDADLFERSGVPILRLDEIHDRLRQRTIVADAAGEDYIDAAADALVHDPARQDALLDGRTDPAGPADRVDGPDMVAMAAFDGDAPVEIDAE